MKKYELTYLISSELSGEEAKEFQSKVASSIQEEGGVLVEENLPLKRKLAYPVKNTATRAKLTEAYLAVLSFQISPEKLAGLEKKLKAEKQILRYLILTKPKLKEVVVRVEKEKKALPKKVELKEIEKKLEEILNEPR